MPTCMPYTALKQSQDLASYLARNSKKLFSAVLSLSITCTWFDVHVFSVIFRFAKDMSTFIRTNDAVEASGKVQDNIMQVLFKKET